MRLLYLIPIINGFNYRIMRKHIGIGNNLTNRLRSERPLRLRSEMTESSYFADLKDDFDS